MSSKKQMPGRIDKSPVKGEPTNTGDKNSCTEPVYAKYMLVICLEYQNFPKPEYAKFFQNILNNGTTISQPSILWD